MKPPALWPNLLQPPGGSTVWRTLAALAAMDCMFVFVHGVSLTLEFFDIIKNVPWYLSVFGDDSPAERTNHIKWLLIAVLLGYSWFKLRIPALLSLAVIFLIVFADDALRIHELGGRQLRQLYPDFAALEGFSSQASELLVWSALGLIVVPIAIWGFLCSTERSRYLASYMIVGLAVAIFAGVVLDTLGEGAKFLQEGRVRNIAQNLAGLIECVGESLGASLSLAFAGGTAIVARSNSMHTLT